MEDKRTAITALLQRFSSGDAQAADELISLLYKDLRRMASYYLRQERRDHTLQPTALVHEAYQRLINQRDAQWQNRSQFFAVAAQLMRRILVDYARRHYAVRRGGLMAKLRIEEVLVSSREAPDSLLALHEMLDRLAEIDRNQAHVVELRIFGGLTIKEVAQLLNLSPATIKREWSMAKAWLSRELARPSDHGA